MSTKSDNEKENKEDKEVINSVKKDLLVSVERPEPLCDCCGARPEPALEIGPVHELAPERGFAPQPADRHLLLRLLDRPTGTTGGTTGLTGTSGSAAPPALET